MLVVPIFIVLLHYGYSIVDSHINKYIKVPNMHFIHMYAHSCLWHTLSFCWSLTLVLKYTDPNKWWQQIPQISSTSEWLFLNASLAYCIYDFIHTDHRRKGALIFYAHHVLTLLLIVLAYAFGFVQVSIVILNVFDVSDIFRPAARICNTFAKAGHLKYKTYANVLFILFATSWMLTRIILFGYIIYQAWMSKTMALCAEQGCPFGFNSIRDFWDVIQMPFIYIMSGLYVVLWIWTLKLYRAIFKIIDGGITKIKD